MAKAGFSFELRRRHVVRLGLAYVAAWLLVQLGAILLPTFGVPQWAPKVLVGILTLLFPVAMTLAWAFEMTPEGIRHTVPAEAEEARPASHEQRVGRVLNVGIIAVLAAAWVRQIGARATHTRNRPQPRPPRRTPTSRRLRSVLRRWL